jgi:predicted nucleic acid-binding protein
MSNSAVIYDACVLYPALLRDLLMQLALTDLYKAKWTNDIHEEWISNCLKNHLDLQREKLERTRDLMNTHVRDCLVDNYQDLISALNLPDPKDRHVLAAAIKCNASTIVTFNLKDFPCSTLDKYNIEALHPDNFIVHHFEFSIPVLCKAVDKVYKRRVNPPSTKEEFLDKLLKQQLPETVSVLIENWY